VIRKSSKKIIAQLIEYDPLGDKVLATVTSTKLLSMGWNASTSNLPAAYLTGIMIGVLSKKKKISRATLDIGMNAHVKGSRVYSCLKGAIEGGLEVTCDDSTFPPDERLYGQHIMTYAKKSSDNTQQFHKYREKCFDMSQFPDMVRRLKDKLLER
jgi:large subunit ribosomal protein L18